MRSDTHVSVLVASYKRPNTLSLALQSILTQTHANFDVLVWNDCGTDMRGRVPELADHRVKYHQHQVNLGAAHAVANGLRATMGEYVAEIDDDDEWEPEFLSSLAVALDQHPSAALAFCDIWTIRADGTKDEAASVATSEVWGRSRLSRGLHHPGAQIAFDGCIPTASGAMLRRSAIDFNDFPAGLSYASDRWLAYLATRDGQGVVYEPRRLARKRRHEGQSGGALAAVNDLQDLTIIYQRVLADSAYPVPKQLVVRRATQAWANLSVAFLRSGDPGRARDAAQRSLAIAPTVRGLAARTIAYLPRAIHRPLAVGASNAVAAYRLRIDADRLGGRTGPAAGSAAAFAEAPTHRPER